MNFLWAESSNLDTCKQRLLGKINAEAQFNMQVVRFKAGSHALACVGAAPDAQSLLVASASLALWSVAQQKRIAKFMGHTVRSYLPHHARLFMLSSAAIAASACPSPYRTRMGNPIHSACLSCAKAQVRSYPTALSNLEPGKACMPCVLTAG